MTLPAPATAPAHPSHDGAYDSPSDVPPAPPTPTGSSPEESLTVSEVAAASDVAPSAVRFYDKYGVISAARTAGNQRRFDASAPCRIQVAKLAQQVGLTVREIADLFAQLPPDPGPEDWASVSDHLVTEAERRVQHLRTQLSSLSSDAKLCEIGAELGR